MFHQLVTDGYGMIIRIIKSIYLAAVFGDKFNIIRKHQTAIQFIGGAFEKFFIFYLAVNFGITRIFDRNMLDLKIAVIAFFIGCRRIVFQNFCCRIIR